MHAVSWVCGVEFLSDLKTWALFPQIRVGSLSSTLSGADRCWRCPSASGAPRTWRCQVRPLWAPSRATCRAVAPGSLTSAHCAHLPADPSCPATSEAVFSRLELAFMFYSIFSRFPPPCDFSFLPKHVRRVSNHGFNVFEGYSHPLHHGSVCFDRFSSGHGSRFLNCFHV